jgi:hypothetical protein
MKSRGEALYCVLIARLATWTSRFDHLKVRQAQAVANLCGVTFVLIPPVCRPCANLGTALGLAFGCTVIQSIGNLKCLLWVKSRH